MFRPPGRPAPVEAGGRPDPADRATNVFQAPEIKPQPDSQPDRAIIMQCLLFRMRLKQAFGPDPIPVDGYLVDSSRNVSYEHDIYLSYHEDEQPIVRLLMEPLVSVSSWRVTSRLDFPPGRTKIGNTMDSMMHSKYFIIVASEGFMQTDDCRFEMDLALQLCQERQQKCIIVLSINGMNRVDNFYRELMRYNIFIFEWTSCSRAGSSTHVPIPEAEHLSRSVQPKRHAKNIAKRVWGSLAKLFGVVEDAIPVGGAESAAEEACYQEQGDCQCRSVSCQTSPHVEPISGQTSPPVETISDQTSPPVETISGQASSRQERKKTHPVNAAHASASSREERLSVQTSLHAERLSGQASSRVERLSGKTSLRVEPLTGQASSHVELDTGLVSPSEERVLCEADTLSPGSSGAMDTLSRLSVSGEADVFFTGACDWTHPLLLSMDDDLDAHLEGVDDQLNPNAGILTHLEDPLEGCAQSVECAQCLTAINMAYPSVDIIYSRTNPSKAVPRDDSFGKYGQSCPSCLSANGAQSLNGSSCSDMETRDEACSQGTDGSVDKQVIKRLVEHVGDMAVDMLVLQRMLIESIISQNSQTDRTLSPSQVGIPNTSDLLDILRGNESHFQLTTSSMYRTWLAVVHRPQRSLTNSDLMANPVGGSPRREALAQPTDDISMDEPLAPDVFLSYATADEAEMRDLVRMLARQSITVWYKKFHLDAGEDRFSGNARGIDRSHCAVCIVSKGYMEDPHCMMEFSILLGQSSKAHEDYLIPVLWESLPESAIPFRLRLHMRAYSYLVRGTPNFEQRLITAIAKSASLNRMARAHPNSSS